MSPDDAWAVGTVRDSNPGSLEELRWAHLLKLEPLSDEGFRRRFAAVEPFYNGQARVERFDGGLEVIDPSGAKSPPHALAKTTTIWVCFCWTAS